MRRRVEGAKSRSKVRVRPRERINTREGIGGEGERVGVTTRLGAGVSVRYTPGWSCA